MKLGLANHTYCPGRIVFRDIVKQLALEYWVGSFDLYLVSAQPGPLAYLELSLLHYDVQILAPGPLWQVDTDGHIREILVPSVWQGGLFCLFPFSVLFILSLSLLFCHVVVFLIHIVGVVVNDAIVIVELRKLIQPLAEANEDVCVRDGAPVLTVFEDHSFCTLSLPSHKAYTGAWAVEQGVGTYILYNNMADPKTDWQDFNVCGSWTITDLTK